MTLSHNVSRVKRRQDGTLNSSMNGNNEDHYATRSKKGANLRSQSKPTMGERTTEEDSRGCPSPIHEEEQ